LLVLKGGELYERFTKTSLQIQAELAELLNGMTIRPWSPGDALEIYEILEHPNWAPWLEASAKTLAARASVFPQGQLVMTDGFGKYAASLSLNQIDWDGNISHLPTWDEVAGDPTDYSTTYKPSGNTLVLLSMNVSPAYKGLQLPSKMIDTAVIVAKSLMVDHLIGSFRPSGFGEAKKESGHELNFEHYCMTTQPNSTKPVDPWLRSLWWKGVQMLAVDPKAMTVTVTTPELVHYQHVYKPLSWNEVKPGVWECGEVGAWTVDSQMGTATYQESNIWGLLPLS